MNLFIIIKYTLTWIKLKYTLSRRIIFKLLLIIRTPLIILGVVFILFPRLLLAHRIDTINNTRIISDTLIVPDPICTPIEVITSIENDSKSVISVSEYSNTELGLIGLTIAFTAFAFIGLGVILYLSYQGGDAPNPDDILGLLLPQAHSSLQSLSLSEHTGIQPFLENIGVTSATSNIAINTAVSSSVPVGDVNIPVIDITPSPELLWLIQCQDIEYTLMKLLLLLSLVVIILFHLSLFLGMSHLLNLLLLVWTFLLLPNLPLKVIRGHLNIYPE